jgi:phosphatidate cytidylyltransferase
MLMSIEQNLSVYLGIGGSYILVGVATLTRMLLQHRYADKNLSKLKAQINSWWLMISLAGGALVGGPLVMLCFCALLSLFCLREYFSLLPSLPASIRGLAYATVPINYALVGHERAFLLFVPLCLVLLMPVSFLLRGASDNIQRSLGDVNRALVCCVFCLSYLVWLYNLPMTSPGVSGVSLAFYLLVLTELNDVTQYIWGTTLGRRPLIAAISPNKSIEGAIGGLLSTTLLAMGLAPFFTAFNFAEAAAAGLLISISGMVGDLVMSAIKRDAAVKDCGTLIPGHGGLLDRLDSLLYTAPIFYYFIIYNGG